MKQAAPKNYILTTNLFRDKQFCKRYSTQNNKINRNRDRIRICRYIYYIKKKKKYKWMLMWRVCVYISCHINPALVINFLINSIWMTRKTAVI